MTHSSKSDQGFTLIELMIVVAIVAILAAVGYPSYAQHVARSRRAEAKSVMLENAQWIERQYTLSNAYNLLPDRATALASTSLPVRTVPRDGGTAFYNIALDNLSATTFTLTATRAGAMSSDPCGTLTLTHTGVKGVVGASLTTAQCWDK